MDDPQGIPDTASLEKAMALKVLNDIGNEVMFGSLFETQQTIVIFIRTSMVLRCSIVHIQYFRPLLLRSKR
jgi:hypothetical protein